MELQTKIHAEDDRQEIRITREFDLPVELLFKAYAIPELVEQWMGTKVIRLDHRTHGGYQFETRDANGNVVFRANGVIHSVVPDRQITRTFEMENTPFAPQLEILEFESLTAQTSRLRMHIVYQTVAMRDQMLRLPFAQGLNMAHNRLEETLKKHR